VVQYESMKQEFKFIHHAFVRACDTALHLLQKGADFAHEKGNEQELLNAKLADDMFTFTRQIQVFTDNVAGIVARVGGLEKISLPDTETTFTELIARVQKTKDFIKNINPNEVEGIEERKIKLPWMQPGAYFEARDYLEKFAMQNVFFHLITAYGILRQNGVQIGKFDFIGSIDFKNE